MKYQGSIIVAMSLMAVQPSWAQSNTTDMAAQPAMDQVNSSIATQSNTMNDVRFFEHFFNDAAVVTSTYVEGGAVYGDFDHGSAFVFGAQGGMPISDQLDIGAAWSFANLDIDGGNSESGITDPEFWGRYHLKTQSAVNITVGGMLTLPVGEEKVGGDSFDFGTFAAARMPVSDGIVVMGSVGLNFVEGADRFGDDDRDLSLHIGGGGIFEVSPETHLIGEVGIDTEEDYFALTGGMDHALSANSRLRAALDIGLDDGAPDFGLRGGFLVNF
ncbi:MAG TPA: hypothetical protein EYP59_09300 [Thiotrichaceae bacterium]|nr:hypothetical protein [Thiotrichaceae bacterium]